MSTLKKVIFPAFHFPSKNLKKERNVLSFKNYERIIHDSICRIFGKFLSFKNYERIIYDSICRIFGKFQLLHIK